MVHAVLKADYGQRLFRALPSLAVAGIEQRHFHLLQRRHSRQQIERLEDEPDLAVADGGQRVVGQVADQLAVEEVAPRRGRIQASQQIEQGRLTRTRMAHDGDHLAFADVERDAAQGVHVDGAHVVRLDEVFDAHDWRWGAVCLGTGVH